jgi:hypothetical protein
MGSASRKSPRGKEPVGDDQATAAHYARVEQRHIKEMLP